MDELDSERWNIAVRDTMNALWELSSFYFDLLDENGENTGTIDGKELFLRKMTPNHVFCDENGCVLPKFAYKLT